MTGEVGSTFMWNTQHERLSPSDQQKGVPQPPLELGWDEARPTINLPTPNELPDDVCDLRTAIENRRSVRQYSGQALTLKELSFLLLVHSGRERDGRFVRHAQKRTLSRRPTRSRDLPTG